MFLLPMNCRHTLQLKIWILLTTEWHFSDKIFEQCNPSTNYITEVAVILTKATTYLPASFNNAQLHSLTNSNFMQHLKCNSATRRLVPSSYERQQRMPACIVSHLGVSTKLKNNSRLMQKTTFTCSTVYAAHIHETTAMFENKLL